MRVRYFLEIAHKQLRRRLQRKDKPAVPFCLWEYHKPLVRSPHFNQKFNGKRGKHESCFALQQTLSPRVRMCCGGVFVWLHRIVTKSLE